MKPPVHRIQRAGVALALSAAAIVGMRQTASAAQGGADTPTDLPGPVEAALQGMDTWVELRGQIAKERGRHAERVAFLGDRIALIRSQVEDTKKVTAKRLDEVEKSKGKREELEAEHERLRASSESLAGLIDSLESRTKDLLKRMPDPLRESLKALSQNLPKDPQTTKLGLSKRFGQVVGLLNLIDKFSTAVHVSTETREIGAGTPAQVTALYLGISTGYYVNAAGDQAGRGYATDTGFEWAPANAAAIEIQQAVRVLNGELPQFVQVPIVLD